MRKLATEGPPEAVYDSSMRKVLDAEDSTQVTSGRKAREWKMCNLQQPLCIDGEEVETTCKSEPRSRSKSDKVSNCFVIAVFYFHDIPDSEDTRGNHPMLSMRRQSIEC